MRTQGEDGHLHAEERGLRRDQPCPHLDLRFQPPGLETGIVCGLSRPDAHSPRLYWWESVCPNPHWAPFSTHQTRTWLRETGGG